MSAPQAAAITACTACAAVGGAAAGGAFSSSTNLDADTREEAHNHEGKETLPKQVVPKAITYKFLADEIGLDTTNYGTGTVAEKYKNYLVGTFGGEDNSNQEWWNDVYSKRYQEDLKVADKKSKLSDELKDTAVKKPFTLKTNKDTAEQNKALNIGCHNLYKLKHKEKFVNGSKDKYINDLWRYCSELGDKPKTISDASETDYDTAVSAGGDTVGKTQKAKLLSTKAEINNKLWDWKQKEFFARTNNTDLEHYFKEIYDQKNNNKDKPGHLKEKCEEAYKMKAESADEQGKVQAATVVKYCSLDGE